MKRALVIIDEQMDYFPGGKMELVGSEAALERTLRVLERARSGGSRIFFIQHIAASPTASFFLPGSPGAALHPKLGPLPGETIVRKNFPNSFRSTDLEKLLREAGVSGLTVCGMMTHMCVDTTVRAAFDLGFSVELVSEACATKDLSFAGKTVPSAEVQTAYLAALSGTFAETRTAEEALTFR